MQKGGTEKPAQCKKRLCPGSAHVCAEGKAESSFPALITKHEHLLYPLSGGQEEGVIRGVSAEFFLKLRDILFLSKVHTEDSRPVSFQHRTMLSPYV